VSFAAYFASLDASLKDKDPSRAKHVGGSLVLVLEDEARVIHRMTVRVGSRVEVVEGRRELKSGPVAFVFATLADWIAFDAGDASRLHSINFYGDLSVLELIAELRLQKLSLLALRAGR
jgi:hypothetical protein